MHNLETSWDSRRRRAVPLCFKTFTASAYSSNRDCYTKIYMGYGIDSKFNFNIRRLFRASNLDCVHGVYPQQCATRKESYNITSHFSKECTVLVIHVIYPGTTIRLPPKCICNSCYHYVKCGVNYDWSKPLQAKAPRNSNLHTIGFGYFSTPHVYLWHTGWQCRIT